MINNKYCPNCLKTNVCSWYDKLSKLKGTDKAPILLDVTVDNCDEFVSVDGEEPEENEE